MKSTHLFERNCKLCDLWKTRTQVVQGDGKLTNRIMFIGEAPGRNEDKLGIPFCGAAGEFLGEMLEKTGLKRKHIYLTNILKCRPPNNRTPEDNEIKRCEHYLLRELERVEPVIVVTLGATATQWLLERLEKGFTQISKLHGEKILHRFPWGNVYIFPSYHPCAALYNSRMRTVLLEDMMVLKNILKKKGLLPKKSSAVTV